HTSDPSRRPPPAPGPNTNNPLARNSSARPSTKGCSGPMTTRSASSGDSTRSAVRPSTSRSAASRPPLPTTWTFTGHPRSVGRNRCYSPYFCPQNVRRSCSKVHELVPAGADADELDRHAGLVRKERDVLAGRGGEV